MTVESMYNRLVDNLKLDFELKYRYLTYKKMQQYFKVSVFQENNYEILLNQIKLKRETRAI